MTSRQIRAYGLRVMRRLGMVEWLEHAVFVRAAVEGCYGSSTWHPDERKCWITVGPADAKTQQETLIHECLHVLYEGHKPPVEDSDPGYELGLNRTAEALWKAWHSPTS